MVTHDSSLAKRVERTVIIADGEVVNEYVARALPTLSPQLMLEVSRRVKAATFPAGATILQEGQSGNHFYILTQGAVEVVLKRPGGSDVVAETVHPNHFFGEIFLMNQNRTLASVRAVPEAPVELLTLDGVVFQELMAESQEFCELMQSVGQKRLVNNHRVLEMGKVIHEN